MLNGVCQLTFPPDHPLMENSISFIFLKASHSAILHLCFRVRTLANYLGGEVEKNQSLAEFLYTH